MILICCDTIITILYHLCVVIGLFGVMEKFYVTTILLHVALYRIDAYKSSLCVGWGILLLQLQLQL